MDMRAVKDKRAELEKMKNTFVRQASEFLRNYFFSLVDFMISDNGYFSQNLKNLGKNCLVHLPKAYCQSLNLLLRREAREFANELHTSTKASRNPAVWLEASSGSSQTARTETSTVSDAYSKMVTIFIPLLVDESSFFAHFMCFEFSALAPPSAPNGKKRGSEGNDGSDDDLSTMDAGNDVKRSNNTAELGALNDALHVLLDGIQFVDEACHQIERNERNVRQIGVLSYITRFAMLATRMEQCIQGQSRDLVDEAYTRRFI